MTSAAVMLVNLSKSFLSPRSEPRTVLRNVTLTIRPSERVALVGPSGSGKTTLLRIVAGLEKPDSGDVIVEGESPSKSSEVLLMSQDDSLFPWLTVLGNLSFPLQARGLRRPETRWRVEGVLESLGLQDMRHFFPRELSGGTRQRVALGRAFLAEPSVLLLDEPFGSLDAISREEMQDVFLAWHAIQKPTVLLVTHSVEEAVTLGDRVLITGGAETGSYLREVSFDEGNASPPVPQTGTRWREQDEFASRVRVVRRALG